MNLRPRIAPDLLPRMLEAAPGRVVRRLEQDPGAAAHWCWHEDESTGRWTVRSSSDEVVTLTAADGRVATPDDVSCTCLVAPRCFHVIAVLSVLEVEPGETGQAGRDEGLSVPAPHPLPGEGETSEHSETSRTASDSTAPWLDAPKTSVSDAQKKAACLALEAGTLFLNAGASATGALLETELARAIHECRALGLHRLAASGLGVARAVRELRDQKPEFRLADLVDDTIELLWVAYYLACNEGNEVAAQWIGTARRPYLPIGTLRVSGLFTEPVIAGNGYAGVTTYLVDARGRILTLADVAPGTPSRVRRAYDSPIDLGNAAPRPRQLGRETLVLKDATASDDLRLGSGADTSAISSGVSTWMSGDPAVLWDISPDAQLDRIFAASDLSPSTRPGGEDLLFVDGRVAGAGKDGLLVSVPRPGGERSLLCCIALSDHAELAYRENLRLLARAPGLPIRLVGRVQLDRPQTLALLAAGPPPGSARDRGPSPDSARDRGSSSDSAQDSGSPPDSARDRGSSPDSFLPKHSAPSWFLPEQWCGRCNMGLDRLQTSHLQGIEPLPHTVSEEIAIVPRDPLDILRRRLSAVVMGGRATVSAGSLTEIDREVARLDERLMPGAAGVLQRLTSAALPHIDPETGAARADPHGFARAWLAAGLYLRATTRALRRATWFQDRLT